MSKSVLSSVQSTKAAIGMPPEVSGPLGPLEPPFATSQSTFSFDVARELFMAEAQHLQERVRDLTSLLEQSEEHLIDRTARRDAAAEKIVAIENDRTRNQFGRKEIFELCQDWRATEVGFVEMRDSCVHLRSQLTAVQRSLKIVISVQSVLVEAERCEEEAYYIRSQANAMSVPQALPVLVAAPMDYGVLLGARAHERELAAELIDERITAVLKKALSRGDHFTMALKQDPSRALEVIDVLKGRLSHVLQEAAMLSFELAPRKLSEFGLALTLETYINNLIETRRLSITAQIENADRHYSPAVESAVFRVAREVLNNIIRHACAEHVRVILRQDAGTLLLTIHDDGVGFDVDSVMARVGNDHRSGLGQLCLETDLLEASLAIESAPGKGTRIDYIIAAASKQSAALLGQ